MEREPDSQEVTYVIPERRITGSVPDILEEIDDMMDALQTVRETIVRRAPRPARVGGRRGLRGRIGRALQKLHLFAG